MSEPIQLPMGVAVVEGEWELDRVERGVNGEVSVRVIDA